MDQGDRSAGQRAEQQPKDRPLQWPYQAGLPQRYAGNYARYRARGGLVRPEEDVRGFVAPQEGNRGDMARFYFFCLVLDQLQKEGITGDLAELGVYKGATATLLANIARHLGTTAYLLDTFEGFSPADFKGVDSGQRVQFTDTSLEAVRKLVGEENVRYVKGYFPETASQLPDHAEYCVVHIDCDLYAPMLSALDYFYPRLVPGGYLIMHDYSSLHWDGAEKAVDQFFADKPESPIALTDGAGSAVIRKAKRASRFDNWLVRRRTALVGNDWISAANNGLGELLGEGWSGPEDWGVWGIGASHELLLFLSSDPEQDLLFEADVYAVLIGSRLHQSVEVSTGDTILATWDFTPQANRGIRSATIPRELAATAMAAQRPPVIRLVFRPANVAAPTALDPATPDARPLGLGVWRIRLAPVGIGR